MTHGRRWWWWTALVGTGAVMLCIAVSFRWVAQWTDSRSQWYLYLEHGVLHGNNIPMPGRTPPARPWCGSFRFVRMPLVDPWVPWPSFTSRERDEWDFKLPLHFALLISLPIVIYPLLPPVIRRQRRRRGLCVKCGFDLTGNESGVCPECGRSITNLTATPRAQR